MSTQIVDDSCLPSLSEEFSYDNDDVDIAECITVSKNVILIKNQISSIALKIKKCVNIFCILNELQLNEGRQCLIRSWHLPKFLSMLMQKYTFNMH